MNHRKAIGLKAFTLIELLVVIGIIAVLAGILLPVVNHARKIANITGQKADFVTISNALEAYKADFGDYPRNAALPRWNTLVPANGGKGPAPIFLSLATALLGPGPGYTQSNGSGYQVGDGADGMGFRGQTINIPITASAVSLTSAPYTITLNPNSIPPQLNNFVPGQMVVSVTLSVGTPIEETVGVLSFIPNQNMLNLAAAPIFTATNPPNVTAVHQATDTMILKIATGKLTPNYLSADAFKVAFVPAGTGFGGPASNGWGPAGEPVILDRWGQVIQYFPRYGPLGNRTGDSSLYPSPTPASQSVIAGPLYGYSQPWSAEGRQTPSNGQNTLWDWRDGAPYFTGTGQSVPTQAWPAPGTAGFDPSVVMLWMLGMSNPSNPPNTLPTTPDAISAPDKLNFDGPFILISAGPNGPAPTTGGYCNFSGLSPGQYQAAFNNSGNIYNFDRP